MLCHVFHLDANVSLPPNHGPYCFKIHGIFLLLYAEHQKNSSYGQFNVLDFASANEVRLEHVANSRLREDVLSTLSSLLLKHNGPFSDPRRYNDSTCSEIAAVLESTRTDGAPPSHRCIAIYARDGEWTDY